VEHSKTKHLGQIVVLLLSLPCCLRDKKLVWLEAKIETGLITWIVEIGIEVESSNQK
jgi:hypothetical protein